MKVFISWSGKLSEDVASLLSEWLPNAVPGTKTWLSSKDIDKGAIWFSDIEKELKDTSVAVICLTRENKERPWVLFEAGALNKGLDKSRVCPLLLDLEDKELDPPLKAFNATKPNKKDMLTLCKTINRQNIGNVFPEPQLERFFNKFWRDFELKYAAIMKKHRKSKPPKKPEAPEMLEKILETVQALLTASQTSPGLARRDPDSPLWIKLDDRAANNASSQAGGPNYPQFIPQIPSGELSQEQQNILDYVRSFGPSRVLSVAKPPEPKLSPGEKPPSKPPTT